MEKINIGLQENELNKTIQILNTLLADEYVLYTKTRNYHWNVVGPQFNDLHKFFQGQYEAVDATIDEVAERTRTLGGVPIATLTEFMKNTRLNEKPGDRPAANVMIGNLLEDHQTIIRSLRTDIEKTMNEYHDAGTSDFLTGIMEEHEKMAWMLRSFLN
jgi:starvation-inducible DNA-binding protein